VIFVQPGFGSGVAREAPLVDSCKFYQKHMHATTSAIGLTWGAFEDVWRVSGCEEGGCGEILVPFFEGAVNVFYERRGWVVDGVVVVVRGVGSYKSGVMIVVNDVEYGGVVV